MCVPNRYHGEVQRQVLGNINSGRALSEEGGIEWQTSDKGGNIEKF